VKAIFKHLRLLPAVVIVGIAVLAFKGVDIARAAQGVAEDLNATLAPTDPGSGAGTHPDYANGEDPSDSASEVDVLTSLTQRRAQLDARERGLDMRENLLNASEGRVNQKVSALQALQTQIQGLLKARDDAQQAQINSLIKTYGPDGMKPAQAAVIFNSMPDEVLIPIAKGMKPGDLGAVMAKMNPDAAQRLTVKLAALLKLPETAVTAACPVPATTADAGTPPAVASAAPTDGNPPVTLDTPPQQTAAATPPPAVTPAPAPAAPTPPAPAKPQQTAATTPPAAPAKPTTTAAATPPKPPHHAPPHHVAHTAPPAKPTNPPVTLDKPTTTTPAPSQAAAATPPKPTTTPAPATTAPAPTQAAATPPKPSATTPPPTQAAAATPPAATPAAAPAATPPASTAPTPLTH